LVFIAKQGGLGVPRAGGGEKEDGTINCGESGEGEEMEAVGRRLSERRRKENVSPCVDTLI